MDFAEFLTLVVYWTYWRPYLPLVEGLPISVLVANIHDGSQVFADPRFSAKWADACDLSFASPGDFDLIHSNSVIEHVGQWREMKLMASEIRRIAPAYYLQTPYYWFPIEPHFHTFGYQWLPEQIRARLHLYFAMGVFPEATSFSQAMDFATDALLLDWRQMQTLFPDAELISERILGLTKSVIAIKHSDATRPS